eukprot:GHVU01078506.1.p1 GENE.GHVU01078506.1~~GHVU01078506.1.p1  ORF type:complete len:256 (+),score=32.87 GHVU01078506.1:806-1573(+)
MCGGLVVSSRLCAFTPPLVIMSAASSYIDSCFLSVCLSVCLRFLPSISRRSLDFPTSSPLSQYQSLRRCPDAFLHVDIKPFNCPEAVDMALDLVRRNGALTRVVFSSFCRRNNRRIRAAQRTDGEVMRTVGPHKLIAAVLAYYVGLLPFMPFSEDAVALPQCGRFFSGAREEFSDDVQRFVGRPLARLLSGAAVVIVGGAFKSRTFIQHLRDRGIATYAWVLNEPEEFERADKLGVDGIMTDFPSTLRRYIDKNG